MLQIKCLFRRQLLIWERHKMKMFDDCLSRLYFALNPIQGFLQIDKKEKRMGKKMQAFFFVSLGMFERTETIRSLIFFPLLSKTTRKKNKKKTTEELKWKTWIGGRRVIRLASHAPALSRLDNELLKCNDFELRGDDDQRRSSVTTMSFCLKKLSKQATVSLGYN